MSSNGLASFEFSVFPQREEERDISPESASADVHADAQAAPTRHAGPAMEKQTAQRHPGATSDIVYEALERYRKMCDDWHVRGQNLRFEGENLGKDPQNDESRMTVVNTERVNANISDYSARVTAHSIRQLAMECNLGRGVTDELIARGRFDILATLFNEIIADPSKRKNHLLRLREGDVGWELRAFLPASYNRLDNIYLHRAIVAAQESVSGIRIKDVHTDLDRMAWNIILDGERKLKEVGDECIAGLRLENTEIGNLDERASVISATVYIERLICTNGMTTEKAKRIRIKDLRVLATQYENTIPPAVLPMALQEQVNAFVQDILGDGLQKKIDESFAAMSDNAARLASNRLEIENASHLRMVIRETLREAGLFQVRGVHLDDVMRHTTTRDGGAIMDPPPTDLGRGWTAWDVYNVITRYLSSLTMDAGEESNFILGGRLLRNAYRVSDPTLNWTRILTRAASQNQGTNVPEITPPRI